MNIFLRIGRWWEERRVLRWSDYQTLRRKADDDAYKAESRKEALGKGLFYQLNQAENRIVALEERQQIPPQIAKDMAILKQQMDRMELYVGLKREPQATHVQGAPKIS